MANDLVVVALFNVVVSLALSVASAMTPINYLNDNESLLRTMQRLAVAQCACLFVAVACFFLVMAAA